MPAYEITGPDGKTYDVNAPDGAPQDQVLAYAKANYKGAQVQGAGAAGQPGLLKRGWEALKVPEKLSREGLNMMADAATPQPEITGNLPRDLYMNSNAVMARSLADFAPGFVSRASILTAGAGPVLKLLGKGVAPLAEGAAGQLESVAGMKPGLLTKAFSDPSLIFSRIPKAARAAYAAENEGIAASKLLQTPSPMRMIMKARQLAQEGTLTEGEALEARKEVDKLWRRGNVTEAFKNTMREMFDTVVKRKSALAEADTAFARGKNAAGLRQLMPQNKYGGASAFKMAIGTALSHMGPVGKLGMMALSPAAMGAGATALGTAAKLNELPAGVKVTALQAIEALKRLRAENVRKTGMDVSGQAQ